MRLFLLLFICIPFQVLSISCPHLNWDKTEQVKLINDGDTITLENGKRVRFIGMNTPEMNYSDKNKSEPYAVKAKALVQRYIKVGDKVHLVFDKTKYDKYGRILAYVYSKTGRHLNLLLLQSGLAKQWVVGKNDRFWKCFQTAEKTARLGRKGLWSDFSPLKARQLDSSNKGYQYVHGQISKVIKYKSGLMLFLDRKLKVWISASRLKKFTKNNISFHQNARLLLSGKVTFSGKKPKMILYHPVQVLP